MLKQSPVFHFLHAHQEHYDLLTRYESIVDSLDDNGLRGSFLAQLGQRLAVFAETQRAREVLSEAAALCDAAGNFPHAAQAYVMLAWLKILTGDFAGVEPLRALALERLRARPVPAVCMLADAGASVASALSGRCQDAVRVAQDGYKRGEAMSDDGVMSFCGALTSFPYICQGDWSRAMEHAQMALGKAPTVYFRGWPQSYLAAAHCASGQVDSALDTLESIFDFIRSVRHELGYLPLAPLLGSAYVSAGQHEKAKALLEELVARADRCDPGSHGQRSPPFAEVAMRTDPSNGRSRPQRPCSNEASRNCER